MKSYEEKTKGSKKHYLRAKRVLPAGVSYGIRDISPYPFYVSEAKGCKIIDVDGNIYTDYWTGHGALILGHSYSKVMDAVEEQIRKGTHIGWSHPLEIDLAERISEMVPGAEMVRYTNSGTEAIMYSSRLARAYTGRKKLAKIEGGWHGGYDNLHKAVHAPFDIPESAGINPKSLEDTIIIPLNDIEAAQSALKKEDVASIVIEPLMGAAGFLKPEPDYLGQLREICDKTGTLLIFDEVISGFRLGLGGGQEYFGVTPDITVLGKIMGGGFPIGAFCGKKEIFEYLDHRKFPDMQNRSFHGGTFTGNPISMIAGIVTLDILKKSNVYDKINALGEKIREGLQDIIDRSKIYASLTGICSTFAIHFQKNIPKNVRDVLKNDKDVARAYYAHMLANNIVYVSSTLPHSFIAEPHTEMDIAIYLEITEEFFKTFKI